MTVAPDLGRCPAFRYAPVRSHEDDGVARDVLEEAHDLDGVQGDLEEALVLHHLRRREHALAGHPCDSFCR